MENRDVDIGQALESRRVGAFQALTLGFGFLILFVDGLDYSAINVGAPSILRAFGAERSAMGAVFGWGYFGIFVGSVLFGIIGDRYGRKPGLVLGVLAYSLPALFTGFSSSLEELSVFRFLAGIGIGGVVPNVIALLTETAPKRLRVTFVMIAFVGYSTGNASIAQVAAWFIPLYGWQVVFIVAGTLGTVLSIVLALFLPESVLFLAETRPRSARLRRLAARAAPELNITSATRIVVHRPSGETQFSLRLLFTSYRHIATPLLWIAFFAESLTFMTLSAWLAVILESAGLAPQQAALTFSYGAVGAMIAILSVGRFIDKFGPRAAVVSAMLAVSLIIYLGTSGLSPMLITIVAVCALACASATHQSLNGIVGGFYPTIIRGNGVGYATGMGRVAAILGPVIVGYLMAAKVPLREVLFYIAAPDLIVAAACVGLDLLRRSASARADFTSGPVPTRVREQLA
jgi:AAHS family 4-hydroxybenzoate transporter-like MFS transporter